MTKMGHVLPVLCTSFSEG